MANLTDWLSFSVLSGESGTTNVQINLTENVGERTRYAVVNFLNEEGLEETLTINQNREVSGDLPRIDPDSFFFYKNGGTKYLTIMYDKPFIINDIPSFITVTDILILNGGYKYTLSCSENTGNTDRTGMIIVDSPYGQAAIPVLQVTYNASIFLDPEEIFFTDSGGVETVSVESVDYGWTATTENDWVHLSTSTGLSGFTTVSVTADPMSNDIELHTSFGRVGEVVFTNGEDTKVLKVNMANSQTGALNDDWLTCYYTIDEEDVGEEFILIYNDASIITSGLSSASTTATSATDVYYITEESRGGMYDVQQNLGNGFYRLSARFSTAGTYVVKYRFHDNIVIPPRALGYGMLRYGTEYVPIYVDNLTKVVVGNGCNGYIGAISCLNENIQEVVLGNGTLFIYCCAFKHAGSKEKDFIFPSGATIEDVCDTDYEAFEDFKCKNFILQKSIEGGLQRTEENNQFYQSYCFRGGCKIPSNRSYYIYGGRKMDLINFPHFLPIDYDVLMIGNDCKYLGEFVLYRYAVGLAAPYSSWVNENKTGKTYDEYNLTASCITNLTDKVVFLSMPEYDYNPFSHGADYNLWAFKYKTMPQPYVPTYTEIADFEDRMLLPDVNIGKTAYVKAGNTLPSDLMTNFPNVVYFNSWSEISDL